MTLLPAAMTCRLVACQPGPGPRQSRHRGEGRPRRGMLTSVLATAVSIGLADKGLK